MTEQTQTEAPQAPQESAEQQQEQPREMTLAELKAENKRMDLELEALEEITPPSLTGAATLGGAPMPTKLPELPLQPTFEQVLRGTGDHNLEAVLDRAASAERNLSRELTSITQNEDLSESAKARRTEQAKARYQPLIAEASGAARERALKGAENARLRSIPMPQNSTLASAQAADSQELMAIQHEADSLIARAEKEHSARTMKDHAKPGSKGMKPATDPTRDVLRDAFSRAMSSKGLEARVGGLAVAKACERLGIDFESIAGEHRTDRHNHALEVAARYENAANALPSGNRVTGGPIFADLKGHGASHPGVAKPGLFGKRPRRKPWK